MSHTHDCTGGQKRDTGYESGAWEAVGYVTSMRRIQDGWTVYLNFGTEIFVDDACVDTFLRAELTGDLKKCLACHKIYW